MSCRTLRSRRASVRQTRYFVKVKVYDIVIYSAMYIRIHVCCHLPLDDVCTCGERTQVTADGGSMALKVTHTRTKRLADRIRAATCRYIIARAAMPGAGTI